MNRYILLGLAVLIVGIYFTFQTESNTETARTDVQTQPDSDSPEYEVYKIEELEVQFAYKTSMDGYEVEELTDTLSVSPEGTEILGAYQIINSREKIELENSESAREFPPTINLMVFKNLQNQSASRWVDSFSTFSNVDRAISTVDRDAVIGGANAVRYQSDGLYVTDTAVVAHGGYVYLFTGAFIEENSEIHTDFKALLDSVQFIETENSI